MSDNDQIASPQGAGIAGFLQKLLDGTGTQSYGRPAYRARPEMVEVSSARGKEFGITEPTASARDYREAAVSLELEARGLRVNYFTGSPTARAETPSGAPAMNLQVDSVQDVLRLREEIRTSPQQFTNLVNYARRQADQDQRFASIATRKSAKPPTTP